jgi:UPF0755 protein
VTDEPVEEGTALGDDLGFREPGERRSHRRQRRSYVGCMVALVLIGLVVGVGYVALDRGVDWARDFFADPEDFDGPGHGKVVITVAEGDSATDIGRTLEEAGVVGSVEAFVDAANANSESRGIQVGSYQMKLEMSAEDAVLLLVDPGKNRIRNQVTIPEGFTVEQIVERVVAETKLTERQLEKVLSSSALGLPEYAEGEPEGYLFPDTYEIFPDTTARSLLQEMVERWQSAADAVGLEEAAAELGYTPHELMTVASLVEAEARGEYMPMVARVIYNRLEDDGAPTYGLLQLDATVNYAHGRDIGARTTEADRQIDSPYNTYEYPGLPPGPIEAPSEAAIDAAASPADGDWLFYVTVNLRTGETKFAATLEEHNANVEELNEYCRNESDRC